MKCQRPTGKWTMSRQQKWQFSAQYDRGSVLCHPCEEYRWPSKPTAGKTAPSNKHTAKQSSKPATMKPAKANKNSHPALTDSDRMDKVGGNTTTCGRCLEMIDVNMTIRCDIWETVLDQECAGIPNDVFEVLLTIIHDSSWVCSDCRNERRSTISQLRAELSTINQVVANMKQMMEGLRSDVDGLRTSGATSEQHITTPYTTPKPSGTSDFAAEVCRTVSDMCKRRKNIVISVYRRSRLNPTTKVTLSSWRSRHLTSFVKRISRSNLR